MEIYKIDNMPTTKSIIVWYFKQYVFIITLLTIMFALTNFGGHYYINVIFIILGILSPLGYSRNISRIIYKISFDDHNRLVYINYFVLWKRSKQIPYSKLHVESKIIKPYKGKPEIWVINLWKKPPGIIGEIEYPRKGWSWNKSQMVDISKKFYAIKSDFDTFQPNKTYLQEPLGKLNSFIRVDYFD